MDEIAKYRQYQQKIVEFAEGRISREELAQFSPFKQRLEAKEVIALTIKFKIELAIYCAAINKFGEEHNQRTWAAAQMPYASRIRVYQPFGLTNSTSSAHFINWFERRKNNMFFLFSLIPYYWS